MITSLCPVPFPFHFTANQIPTGSVLEYIARNGTAKGFSALVLKAAGIVEPTALQRHVAFFWQCNNRRY